MSAITQLCTACNGVGTRMVVNLVTGEPYLQDPCEYCEGDGQMPAFTLDDTLLQDIRDKLDDNGNKLDDIWEKLNE